MEKSNLRQKQWLIIILAVALALRLFVLYTQGHVMYLGTDDKNYRISAMVLIKTGQLTYGGFKEPTVFIMPGYPVILAAVFAVVGSASFLAARLVQVVISIFTLWLLIKLGERIGGKPAAVLTGIMGALYPPNLTAPNFLMTESVFTFFFLAAILAFGKAEDTRDTKWFIITGFLVGLSVYIRPTSAPLPFVFALYLLWRRYPLKRILHQIGVMGVVLVLTLSPWIVRNYIHYHELIPLTVSGGNPFLRGTFLGEKINQRFPWRSTRLATDRAQMEMGKQRFVRGFKTNFKGYLHWYTVDKFKDFWGYPYYYRVLSYLSKDKVNYSHWFILIFGTAGTIIGLMRKKPLVVLLLLVSGFFMALHMLYLTGPRYSYPVIQLVIVLAAYPLGEIFQRIRGILVNKSF